MSCFSNLVDANRAIAAGATITLCENTVFPVGLPLDNTFTAFSGGVPLIIDAADVTVQCGTSGKSTGKCVLDGGASQLLIGNPADTTTSANNLKVSGLTFQGIMESALKGAAAPRVVVGTNKATGVVLDDCIFKDIQTTGYVIDLDPNAANNNEQHMTISNTVFSNITHGFDAVAASKDKAHIMFNKVSFTNMGHMLPEAGVGECGAFTKISDCGYTSSIIKLAYTDPLSSVKSIEEAFVDVTVTESNYYTAILQTLGEWGFGAGIKWPFTTLIKATNVTIFNETSRTANDDYCEGGYAVKYNITTGIDWQCKRVTYDLNVNEILRCGINCNANGNFSKFLQILNLTDLDDAIAANKNEIAIFAPTDKTLDASLAPGYLDSLIANDTKTLKELFQYHITSEDPVTTEGIKDGFPAAKTIQGESLSFTPATDTLTYYQVDKAPIIHADWEETPGKGKVIQVIDNIINPSTITILPPFSKLITSLGLKSFFAAAAAAGFDPNLNATDVYTIFAPSDAAIANSSTAKALLANPDKPAITKLLSHHIVRGNYSMADLSSSGCQNLQSLAGLNVKITFANGKVQWNDAFTNSTVVDQLAFNGILHVVDGLMSVTDIVSCPVPSAGVATFGHGGGLSWISMPMMLSLVGTLFAMWML